MGKPSTGKSNIKNDIGKGQMTLSFSKGKMGIENSQVKSQEVKIQSQIEENKEEAIRSVDNQENEVIKRKRNFNELDDDNAKITNSSNTKPKRNKVIDDSDEDTVKIDNSKTKNERRWWNKNNGR